MTYTLSILLTASLLLNILLALYAGHYRHRSAEWRRRFTEVRDALDRLIAKPRKKGGEA